MTKKRRLKLPKLGKKRTTLSGKERPRQHDARRDLETR